MITMFSQNDGKDINQVLSDENLDRTEIYMVINALECYFYHLDDMKATNEQLKKLSKLTQKFKRIANVDIKNENR